MPPMVLAKIGPSAAVGRLRSRAIAGAARLMLNASNPSTTVTQAAASIAMRMLGGRPTAGLT